MAARRAPSSDPLLSAATSARLHFASLTVSGWEKLVLVWDQFGVNFGVGVVSVCVQFGVRWG